MYYQWTSYPSLMSSVSSSLDLLRLTYCSVLLQLTRRPNDNDTGGQPAI